MFSQSSVDCFNQLSRQIVDLSKEHFGYLPIAPPKDILEKIPSGIPSFLENTQGSRELRSAYVQHFISKVLTYRIFQPFLFTLGRRYDKADTFFQMLSMGIRRKSVRREAFWRQQTLKAAYTASDAKQAINVVAAIIVDEIVDHIKHFAEPERLNDLITGVRKIVKLAAETWRHARVERELIQAAMPGAEDDEALKEAWGEYTYAGDSDSAQNVTGNGPPADNSGRRVILRLFPRISREPAHEDFLAEDREKGSPCLYAHGVALYADSPSIIARRAEFNKRADPNLDEVSPARSRAQSQDGNSSAASFASARLDDSKAMDAQRGGHATAVEA